MTVAVPIPAAIVLAAGRARRFGGADKLTAEIGGVPVLRWTVQALIAAGIGDVLVVTGPDDDARRAAVADLSVAFAINPQPDQGQGCSIACGIAALRDRSDGVLIVPGDMPAVGAALVADLVAAFRGQGGTRIVFATVEGAQRPPVLWPGDLLGELAGLTGDSGGRSVITRYPFRAAPQAVAASEAWRLDDIDTPDDLALIAARLLTATGRPAP